MALRGKLTDAIKLLRQARSVNCTDSHVLAMLGGLLWMTGEQDAAVIEVQRAVAGGSSRADVLDALSELPHAFDDLLARAGL